MGMVGLRTDVLFVAPASSFHHLHHDSFISDHHHQNQNNHQSVNNSGNNSSTSATTLGIGGIPLLSSSTTPCGDGSSQLWQNINNYPNKKPFLINQENSPNLINNNNPSFVSTISSTRTCQDCGNQAKKDCSHSRCRTCCKSHGYDCATHVKSTWMAAAARRRDRLPVAPADQPDAGGGAGSIGRGGGSCGPTSAVKKPRLVTSQTSTTPSHTSTSTPPRSVDTTSSHHQDASFREALPRQVLAPASFKCVRVTAISDGDDEIAYQAIVKIGGHVFKGFLYNKGLNLDKGLPDIAKLHLSGEGGDGGGRNWASSSSLMVDPSNVYATSGSGLLGSGDLKSSFFSHLHIQ